MIRYRRLPKTFLLECVAVAALLTSVGVATHAAARQQDPFRNIFPEETPGPPFYTNLAAGYLPHDGDLAVVFFYRSPECIPADFNLLDYIDLTPAFPDGPPRPFLCDLHIRGRGFWHSADDPAPKQQIFYELDAVPTWIIAWSELEAAASDGVLTITELASLPSIAAGEAFSFTESVRNTVPELRPGSEALKATGLLSDGRSFVVHLNEKFIDGVHYFPNAQINID
jgi:hypothetical protein